MILSEKGLLKKIDSAKRITLIQPSYRTKYPPLGLAKIKAYAGGRCVINDTTDSDLICITSLFTFDSDKVFKVIDEMIFFGFGGRILLGGVFASLMAKKIDKTYGNKIDIFKGYSKTLDETPPDIDGWEVHKSFKDYCFIFTTRGCPNRCAYCAVHRIENEVWRNGNWKNHIIADKKVVMISDNNLSSWGKDHIADVVDTITAAKKKVVFDNGLDCKLVDREMATILSRGKYERSGMRLAFDRIEEDTKFRNAIRLLKEEGIKKTHLMAYVLFNFKDTPKEANYRMEVCKELGVRPYPQQYTPLNKLDKKDKFIGKHWTPELVKVFRYFWLMAGYYTKRTFEDYLEETNPELVKDFTQNGG